MTESTKRKPGRRIPARLGLDNHPFPETTECMFMKPDAGLGYGLPITPS
jgi:hypothetical protein